MEPSTSPSPPGRNEPTRFPPQAHYAQYRRLPCPLILGGLETIHACRWLRDARLLPTDGLSSLNGSIWSGFGSRSDTQEAQGETDTSLDDGEEGKGGGIDLSPVAEAPTPAQRRGEGSFSVGSGWAGKGGGERYLPALDIAENEEVFPRLRATTDWRHVSGAAKSEGGGGDEEEEEEGRGGGGGLGLAVCSRSVGHKPSKPPPPIPARRSGGEEGRDGGNMGVEREVGRRWRRSRGGVSEAGRGREVELEEEVQELREMVRNLEIQVRMEGEGGGGGVGGRRRKRLSVVHHPNVSYS